jgi:hypothetical protein
MKTSYVKLKKLSVLFMAFALLSSCGKDKKKNEVDANTLRNGNPFSNGGYTGANASAIQQIDQQYPCPGGQRVSYRFTNPSVGGSPTAIGGPFQPGQSNGTTTGIYVGVSPSYHDMMIVSKVTNGGQTAINIELSMCQWIDNGIPFISQQRQAQGFTSGPAGIVLNAGGGSQCPTGNAIAMDTSLVLAPIQFQGINLNAFEVRTSFVGYCL